MKINDKVYDYSFLRKYTPYQIDSMIIMNIM